MAVDDVDYDEDQELVRAREGELGDDQSDEEDNGLEAAHTTKEKKREQNTIFKSWVTKKVDASFTKEINDAMKTTDDEVLSIRGLLAKQEGTNIIKDPREYQMELFERAKQENIIAVLDTGSGKTLIAVLLLRHILDQELENRAAGKAPRIAFFLVDSVTLVFQQFNVLETNLDHKVDRFCGAMKTDLWSKQVWDKHFATNMVLVCTAEVLAQCLMHSFIKMEQINLLIFDEAHHAKKNHAYARIMRDYYITQPDPTKSPKIFGMTASPVDSKESVEWAAMDLEDLLKCKIATTADLSLLQKSVSRPTEEICLYPSIPPPFETQLYQRLHRDFGDVPAFGKMFTDAKMASSHLGRWCSDMFWSFALTDEEERKLEGRQQKAYHADKNSQSMKVFDAQIERLREAAKIVQEHDFGSPKLSPDDLSPKVLSFASWLLLYFERPTDARCIVFVERRQTARLLQLIFQHLGGPHLRPGVLVGAGSTSIIGNIDVSFHQQVMTMIKFRKGELNCLFSTSIGEEGLDIPDCNLVIRFDLYKTMIQYVQSRGRARHRNSKYIHMVETGNYHHQNLCREVRHAEAIMRQFCEALPEDRLLHGNDFDNGFTSSNSTNLVHTVNSTGAKLTHGTSMSVLSHFVSSLSRSNEPPEQPQFIMTRQADKYVCEVKLPENCPIPGALGIPCRKKALAKQSAAFEACVLLRKGKYLDENLLPIYVKQLPAMRNALLALNSKKSNMYNMRLKPSIWETTRGSVPTQLFLTIIDLPMGLDRPHQPLGLLTRECLPEFPEFPLHLNDGKVSIVKVIPLKFSFHSTQELLEHLTSFTLRIYKDLFNKTFENEQANMSYWLAPIVSADNAFPEIYQYPENLIDKTTLKVVFENDEYTWSPEMDNSFLANRFLVDRWDGGRRFFSVKVTNKLTALDAVPPDTVKSKRKNVRNILDYTISLWSKSRQRATWNENQPVIEASQVLHRRNMLAEPENREVALKTKCYVCPQPLKISALPPTVATIGLVFPAIIYRLDSYMTALDATKLVNIRIGAALALEAMTKDSDNSEEHSEEKVNFQRGMGSNYERLEFMGDCFLKMGTTIALFGLHPESDEFDFHVHRMVLICNANLFKTAKKLKIQEYIRSQAFSRRTWYPEGLKLIEGKGAKNASDQVMKHSLGDKTVADVCEALIGAAFMEYNIPGVWNPELWENAIKAVTALVDDDNHRMQKWEDYVAAYVIPAYQTDQSTASQRDLAEKVAKEHPYKFNYPRLLRSAFLHPSYPYTWEKLPSYQRLEFLGDALLDMTCITHLFYRFPGKDPQWLTEHKMAMVSNKFLGAVCVKIGFHRHLRFNHAQIECQVREYAIEIQEAERESKGARDYWTTVKAPPKCLPDIVESYVGALFIDSNFNYGEVQRFFDTHIAWFFEDMSIYDTFANNHPTTQLHHLLAIDMGCTDYRLLSDEIAILTGGPPKVIAGLMIHNKVVAEGVASSGKNAKVKASLNALELIQGLAPFEFRAKFGCGCRQNANVEDEKWPSATNGDLKTNGVNGANGETAIAGVMIEQMGTAV
ncbi:hypothetical protein M501DRAFT_1031732 [Patellaria atrata CBS 101060]|uniref:Dicer-like protein 1 n=1 Tax=Patellaria atrata CBS 101060 TaxID=1346257 RepID=A0A9P4S9X7_9PEZI|nr:hypothetical protein M501DRAFT_1031732 [Patellaria atrata CBS 101060]